MEKTRVSYKAWVKYFSTIITWSVFVILVFCAIFLLYYFVTLQVYRSKGEKYKPPFTIYTIVSPSMVPTIKVYDVIINKSIDKPTDIKIGDIITFKSTSAFSYDMTITHRVKDVQVVNGEYQFVTQGDNNAVKDSAPALYSNVIGIAKMRLPQLGRLQFFVASKYGWFLVVIVPALIIVVKDVIKLVNIAKIKEYANEVNSSMIMQTEKEDEEKRKLKDRLNDDPSKDDPLNDDNLEEPEYNENSERDEDDEGN